MKKFLITALFIYTSSIYAFANKAPNDEFASASNAIQEIASSSNATQTPDESIQSDTSSDKQKNALLNSNRESDIWEYELNSSGITIKKYKGTDTDVIIPENIEGHTVTGLQNYLFSGLGITSVEMPDTVETIGWGLFSGCKKLTDVKLSNSLKKIPEYTFSDCRLLESIDIPESVETIHVSAFDSTILKSFHISSGIKEILFDDYSNMPSTIAEYTVDSNNTEFKVIDGMVLNYKGDTLYFFKRKVTEEYITIKLPDSITTIKSLYEIFSGLSHKEIRYINVRLYLGKNIKQIEHLINANRYQQQIWADSGSDVYQYVKIRGYTIYPATEEEFDSITDSDFRFYPDENGNLTASEYYGNADIMEIPSNFGNITVNKIHSGLFYDAGEVMIIPETITEIESHAGDMGYQWGINENKRLYKIINNSDIEIPVKGHLENYKGMYSQQFSGGEQYDVIPARATAYKHYKITYKEVYNANQAELIYEYGYGEEITLPIPVAKPGYEFAGWYRWTYNPGGDSLAKIPSTKIEIGNNENLIFHAKYTEKSGTTNKPGDSTNKPGNTSLAYDEGSSGGEPASSLPKKAKTSAQIGFIITNPPLVGNTGKWILDGNNWKYQLPDNTYANQQWVYTDDKWYLVGMDHTILRGWQLVNGKWYLLNWDGAMLTGWQQVNHKWYYMNLKGEMLSDQLTPDGYRVDKDGAWIQ
ncbi:MAG: leucine-rich repeat protein [Lachnospiraceae bacterium]|nr:leucine-rich repeat protein [Lachnospiraceae bacterium]